MVFVVLVFMIFVCFWNFTFRFNYAGTNIQTNEEVAIKLVSFYSFIILVGNL